MKTMLVLSFAVLVLSAASANAQCAYTATAEPAIGALRTGVTICVDDGSCGRGKVKEITGGSRVPFVKRTRRCVQASGYNAMGRGSR